ncbi:MAG: hypothetical protein ABRQ24_06325 [Syntrophomonadaceae bacterium]
MINKFARNIGLVLLFVLFIIMNYWNTLRNSVFYILWIVVLGIFYKYKTQKDNLGQWYINKLHFFVLLFIFVIPATAYTLFATGNCMILSVVILIAAVIAFLVSLEKGEEGNI